MQTARCNPPDPIQPMRIAFPAANSRPLHGVEYVDCFSEVLNGGVFPLQYANKKRNKAGDINTYLDGIKLLFTYFTKPESILIIGETLQKDDDVIRSSSFKIRKQRLFPGASVHCSM